jgi:leader peptidase (prepilin peptidase)/N-methyltransferase
VLGALGAAIGSFLNVVIHRVPLGESVVSPPSSCPDCGHPIRAFDNVPVLSWLVLRGRCRDCGSRISARYPLIELAGAAAFVGVAMADGLTWMLALDLPLAALRIAIAAIDLDHRIIPNALVYPAAVFAPIALALIDPGLLPEHLIAGAAAFAFFLLVALAYPAGMGMGDVKLAGVMGLYLGLSVVPALLVAFTAGSVVGIALLVRHGSKARKQALPFGPFLALGGIVGLVAGPALIALYSAQFLG